MPFLGLGLGLPRGGAVQAFSPAALFAASEPGVWYDPSDLSTMYQDAAGTTPVTAVEQPVGLRLDKSRGLVLGSELVTNGDFSSATGWTVGTGWTISGGVASSNNAAGTFNYIGQSIVFGGKWYKITLTISNFTSGSCVIALGTNYPKTFTANGTYTLYATPSIASGGTLFGIYAWNGGVFSVDNVSVRELPGSHAYQTTDINRPVLSARKNLLVNTETLSTQNVTVRAVEHVLSFWGTGTITLSGVSTAGPLVGTGAANRVYVAFTPTAGTLTLTVSGTVSRAQLEETREGA